MGNNNEELVLKGERTMRRQKKRRKKTVERIVIFLLALIVVYFGPAIYFTKHLYVGSEINGINVSGKTVQAVKAEMMSELLTYNLNLKERGNKEEQIKAADIDLKYNSDEQINSFKDEQNPLTWISQIFDKDGSKMTAETTYNKELLKKQIEKLSLLDASKIIEPKNAGIKYEGNAYVIENEVMGTKINKDVLLERAEDAVSKQEATIDLDSANCYINPQYTSKSQKVVEARDLLNKYVASKITYTFGEHQEVIDGSTINKWLTVDDNYVVTLDEKKVRDYVIGLAYNFNTTGRTRNFATSSGNTISVGGGDYGWQINIDKETKDLIAAIKEGQAITKEPAYTLTAASRGSSDIGNTYVEIDMTKQHLWFYKNGTLVVEGDVVTGNVSLNFTTPGGIYRLKYKEKDTHLRGQDYDVPVGFFMPFNGGIGIHDATWRSEFGKDIYKTNGSHGCINAPYPLAKTIYENIDAGTPVVCYY